MPEFSSNKRQYNGGKKQQGNANGFKSLGLSDEVYSGIVRMGFRMPTPVQRKSLPIILSGVDTVVMARTGSGKTCAFLIPLVEQLLTHNKNNTTATSQHMVRGIVLSPTRELSQQTLRVLQKLVTMDGVPQLRAIGIHGGEGMEKQFHLLSSKPDVIVATPGRLAHHVSEIPDFSLGGVKLCILDEADRLIEMGFALQIRQITRTLPELCQKCMLSATMPKCLIEFTKGGFSTDPTVVRLDKDATVSEELRIAFVTCRSLDKDAALLHVMQHIQDDKDANAASRTGLTLIFAATRHHVEYLCTLLVASGVDATLIYGTLDQQARKENLAAFRSGNRPVLVVTDVAARGIDVPLIDHVIHYHFPPSPKLFVHRSGRAARAGRIGYCWGLVEPDELPYMIDLHLFLGRKPSSAGDENVPESYTLKEMSPEMVHYGSLPELVATHEVENVARIMNSELSGSLQAESLRALTKVCRNAMQQYRRTRPEASRQGVGKAKAILEGKRTATGERIGQGALRPHPLLRGMELLAHAAKSDANTKKGRVGDLENLHKREEFLRAVSNFRPKETVFEAFATGKSKDTAVNSHIDKGRTTQNKKNDSGVALSAMKNMRRQMRMARDKGSTLIVAGSTTAEEANGDTFLEKHADIEDDQGEDITAPIEADKGTATSVVVNEKRRLSKAERRRLKKNPRAVVPATCGQREPKKMKRGSDFRDTAFFIENDASGNNEESERSRRVEAAMQPSAATARGAVGNALRMEEAMLDLVGDENDEMIKKQRMMRWDKSKRKYVRTTVGEELSGDSKSKRLRLESGQLVKHGKLKLGEQYQKWQKKTNRSVGRNGVFDDNDGPTATFEKKDRHGGARTRKGKGQDDKMESDVVRTSHEIKKDRDSKLDQKMKNMKKNERKHVERKQKSNAPNRAGAAGGKKQKFQKKH